MRRPTSSLSRAAGGFLAVACRAAPRPASPASQSSCCRLSIPSMRAIKEGFLSREGLSLVSALLRLRDLRGRANHPTPLQAGKLAWPGVLLLLLRSLQTARSCSLVLSRAEHNGPSHASRSLSLPSWPERACARRKGDLRRGCCFTSRWEVRRGEERVPKS